MKIEILFKGVLMYILTNLHFKCNDNLSIKETCEF